jgi:hypothetical protein
MRRGIQCIGLNLIRALAKDLSGFSNDVCCFPHQFDGETPKTLQDIHID